LKGHAGQVTTVKQLEEGGPYHLVSGDSVGEVRLWSTDNDQVSYSFVATRNKLIRSVYQHVDTGSQRIHLGARCSHWIRFPSRPYPDGRFGRIDQALESRWRKARSNADDRSRGKAAARPTSRQSTWQFRYVIFHADWNSAHDLAPVLIAGLTDRRIRIYTFTNGQFTHALSLEGHEDWVRCLSISPYPSSSPESTDLLLASGSHDNYIRLWRISRINEREANEPVSQGDGGLDMLDEFERKLAGEAGGSVQISTKAHVLSIEGEDGPSRYNITLEALLMGHEAGVTNITWSPSTTDPLLLSTSSDNSIILWAPSSSSTAKDGIWVPEQRFGATGGRGLGFHGPMWSTDGKSVMATGWNGGLERWTEVEIGVWEPRGGLSGHFGSVESCVWAPNGDYILSVG
jgi:elongator complex protein 2